MTKLDKARNLLYLQWADDISEASTTDELEGLLRKARDIDADDYLREDVGEMIFMHASALGIPLPGEEP